MIAMHRYMDFWHFFFLIDSDYVSNSRHQTWTRLLSKMLVKIQKNNFGPYYLIMVQLWESFQVNYQTWNLKIMSTSCHYYFFSFIEKWSILRLDIIIEYFQLAAHVRKTRNSQSTGQESANKESTKWLKQCMQICLALKQ